MPKMPKKPKKLKMLGASNRPSSQDLGPPGIENDNPVFEMEGGTENEHGNTMYNTVVQEAGKPVAVKSGDTLNVVAATHDTGRNVKFRALDIAAVKKLDKTSWKLEGGTQGRHNHVHKQWPDGDLDMAENKLREQLQELPLTRTKPASKGQRFGVGATVDWLRRHRHLRIPRGAVGKVLKYHDDGLVNVQFPSEAYDFHEDDLREIDLGQRAKDVGAPEKDCIASDRKVIKLGILDADGKMKTKEDMIEVVIEHVKNKKNLAHELRILMVCPRRWYAVGV